jgi:hypothetical protein
LLIIRTGDIASSDMSQSNNVKKKESIRIEDYKTKEICELSRRDFQEKLDEVINTVKKSLGTINSIGKYQLKSFEITVGVTAGLVIVTLEGGLTLHYELTN